MMRVPSALFACALCVLPFGCTAAPQRVERSPTTGDKLRAIDAARRGDHSWRAPGAAEVEIVAQRTRIGEWCDDLRARLLAHPPSMYAEIDCDRAPGALPLTAETYPRSAPRLFAPVDRERAALEAAHAVDLLSDGELNGLLELLAAQAKRPAFRSQSERGPVQPASGDEWLGRWLDAYANVERVAGTQLPSSDPNPPRARWTRPWRDPDFWVDPSAPSTP